jgi:TolA-binding protein
MANPSESEKVAGESMATEISHVVDLNAGETGTAVDTKNFAKLDSLLKKVEWIQVSTVIANLCQLVMAGFVVWGFFVTVLPIAQKEQLAEDMAKLQREQKTWSEQLAQREQRVRLLQERESKLIDQITALKERQSTVEKRLTSTLTDSSEANKRLQTAEAERAKISDFIFQDLVDQFTGNTPIPAAWSTISARQVRAINQYTEGGIVDPFKAYPKPLEVAQEMIASAKATSSGASSTLGRARVQFVKMLEQNLAAKETWLVCPVLNIEAWKASRSQALNLIPEKQQQFVDRCVEEFWSGRQIEEGWSQEKIQRLKLTSFGVDQNEEYVRGCQAGARSSLLESYVDQFFEKRWEAAIEPCLDRTQKLPAILTGQQKFEDLTPWGSLEPPSPQVLEQELFGKMQFR